MATIIGGNMKRFILTLLIIGLSCSVALGSPSNSMSITPVASDGGTIEASDENARNNEVSSKFNAHSHTDITQLGNTVKLGDGTTGNKTIQANNTDTNKPFLRWDDTNNVWVISINGTDSSVIASLSGTNANFSQFPESVTEGDILIAGSANWQRLAIGTANQRLSVNSGATAIEWTSSAGASIATLNTSVATTDTGSDGAIAMVADGTTMQTITDVGIVSTVQPAFQFRDASDQDNITAGSDITIEFDTVVFDQGSDFASNTFTAPIDGRYQFNVVIKVENLDIDASNYSVKLVTSNRTYMVDSFDPRQGAADLAGVRGFTGGILADMDTSDTALVVINQAGGANQSDIIGGVANSSFSGYLAT